MFKIFPKIVPFMR